MWGPRYGHYGYGRRRYDYDYWWHAPRAFFTVIPLLQAAQEHLTTAATPVTLALLVLQVALHYRGYFLPGLHAALPHLALSAACLEPASWFELQRLVFAPLLHVDETHLYYNMLSLISKGASLEPQLAVDSCSVGFSSVLFALKVVSTWHSRGDGHVFGIRMPNRWLSWGELVLIQLIAPNTSFLGHLSGILAGLAYIAPPRALRVLTARLRQLVRRARSAAAEATERWSRPAPARAPRAARAPALSDEELRALYQARFAQPPQGASAPPQPREAQPAAPPQQSPAAPSPPRAPPKPMPTAEELRALHVARFSKTQRPRGASPPPYRRR